MEFYRPHVGDKVACNPNVPHEIFEASDLPINQLYTVDWVGTAPDGEGTYVNVVGEDGNTYEYFSPDFFIKVTVN